MGKSFKRFFSFAYRLIHFIFFIPIKTIKYFFIGFFYINTMYIGVLVNIIVFVSFCLYKVLKYVCLFFTFPIVLYNLKNYNKKIKVDNKQSVVSNRDELAILQDTNDMNLTNLDDDKKVYQLEPLTDNKLSVDSSNNSESDSVENADKSLDTISQNTDITSNIKPKKKRKIKIFKGFVLLFELMCFPIYKIVKYALLSLTFPYMIYNFIKKNFINRNIKEKNVELVENKNDNVLPENKLEINQIIDEAKKDTSLSSNEDTIIDLDRLFDSEGKNIDSQLGPIVTNVKKVDMNKKRFNLFLLLEYMSYPIYKIFKYFTLGFIRISSFFLKKFTVLSFNIYRIFKYVIYSLALPVMILNLINNNSKVIEKRKLKEQRRLARHEAKFKKQLENQQRQEDELRQNIKKKRKNEEYINENVKIEKKSFKENLDETLNYLFNLPKKIKDSINSKAKNSVFAKNRRNKLDINRQALLIDFEGEDAEKSDFKVVYQYTAKNKDGKIVTDYFEAFSKVEVHSYLLSEGYEVYNIKTNRWIQFAHKNMAISKVKMKNKDLIFFLTQLSTYIKAGIPLVDSLKIVSRQFSKNKNYKHLFDTVIYDLTMGENFSTALSKQGEAFPKILINMVKASEMTGELPEVLDDMSNYFDEMNKTRKQMITALMYPIIVFVLSIIVVVFIMLFVIPRFVSIYESIDESQIPKFTLAILAISDFLKKYIIHLIVITIIIVFTLRYLYKNIKSFRTICQWLFMHTPVIKNVIIYNEVTTFTKTFASLLGHNVFITDSMEILNRVTNNEIYKMLILDTITNLAKGEKISTSFKDHWAFPVPAYEMLVTGEQTGQLPEMMAKVSDYYQELHKNSVSRIKTFIEPILIIFLTAVVGAIVLAIVIPMISLYQTVQNYS